MEAVRNPRFKVRRPVLPGLPGGARVLLAPLCGITSAPFRAICLEFGAELVVTEMISSEAVTRGKSARIRALAGLDPSGGPTSVQIFGADPGRMGETAAILSQLDPVYIDMNFGCPVRKIVTKNGGAAVLRDLSLLGRICREVVRRSGVPVSAKIRAGWDEPSGDHVREIARVIEQAGVAMLAVHARTRRQAFAGNANWDLIAEVGDAVGIPVVGNGDVKTAEDAVKMARHTGCAAVMIGRAAIGNPWIFSQIRARLDGGAFADPTPAQRVSVLVRHVADSVRLDGEPLGVVATRRVTAAYLKDLPNARELRGRLMQALSLDAVETILADYLDAVAGRPGDAVAAGA